MPNLRSLWIYLALMSLLRYHEAKNDDALHNQFGRAARKQAKPSSLGENRIKDIITDLSKTFRSIGNDELGLTEFQDILDKLDFVNIPNSPENDLNNLADSINIKLEGFLDVLERSLQIVLPIIEENNPDESLTNRLPDSQLQSEKLINFCSQIENDFVLNGKHNQWKHLRIFPFSKRPGTICGQSSHSRNIGSLFLSQCDRPKNVIVLMEHGTFMSEEDITLGRAAAKTIVDILSESDFVTMIGLAGHGFVECKSGLVESTDINKFHLIRQIDAITKSDSNESLSIDFDAITKNLSGDVIVIHITNTMEDISDVKKILAMMSLKKLSVHFRTVLILPDLKSHVSIEETSINGSIITLPTNNILGYDIARLFSNFRCPTINKKDYYLSETYYEPYSKTMSLLITRATDTVLVSMDIKLRELVQDITYFNAGLSSRAILFNKKGIVLMHKNFPRVETLQDQPLKVYLKDIENIEKNDVDDMIAHPEGKKEVTNKLGKICQFRWKHLKYLDLIACVVYEANNITRPVVEVRPSLPDDILYHRLDLVYQLSDETSDLCIDRGSILSPSRGVVYLSPWSLKSSMEDLDISVTLQSYMAYITDKTTYLANPGLGPSVQKDVATLAQILDHFKERNSRDASKKFIIRRYVTSVESGVVEIFPGISLDSSFDPKRRIWYAKALENPGKIILTGPYLDAGGSGYVLTLSQTIFEGRRTAFHGKNDPIFAVASMDMTMGYIARLIHETLPFCKNVSIKCFLMDEKGYLITHPSLLEPGASKFEQQHLTHKELLVANDILNHELFVKKKICVNHLDGTIQRYYQFNTSLDEVLTNIVHGEHCVKYQIAAIPGTNLFFGVVNETCLLPAFCPCSTKDRLCLNCKRMEQTECECPCECSLYTSGCERGNVNSVIESCSAPYEQGIPVNGRWGRVLNPHQLGLNQCPSINCKSFETESSCLGIVGCQWCSLDTDGESILSTPFCSNVHMCFRGILGSILPYADSTFTSQTMGDNSSRDWPSVGPIIGGILAIIIIFRIIIFCYRLHNSPSGLEHECLHVHGSPDSLRMMHLDIGIGGNNGGVAGDPEPINHEHSKNNVDNLQENVASISPYRVSTNYRRPPGGDSDHGYSTMTPHDDTEQQSFAEPLLLVGGTKEPDHVRQSIIGSPVNTSTCLESSHRVLAPVTVHRNMEPNYL